MREIVFDTETTGFEPGDGHRIVEIGCVELMDHFPTGRTLQFYLNPERDIPIESQRVHGLSAEFLAGLTGGIFFCHVLFINLVRSGLGDAGITPHLGWAGTVAVTFVLTMGSAALFTALLLRTP